MLSKPYIAFKCQFCTRNFASCSALEEHVDQGHDGLHPENYDCHLCSKSFQIVENLQRHLNIIHPLLEPNFAEKTHCAKFKKESSSKKVEKRSASKNGKAHTMSNTPHNFRSFVNLVNKDDGTKAIISENIESTFHYKLVRNVCSGKRTVQQFYQCQSCLTELAQVVNVKSHHTSFHPDIPDRLLRIDTVGTEITSDDPSPAIVTSKSPISCSYCLSILSSISHLQRHVVSHHFNRVVTTDMSTTRSAKRNHYNSSGQDTNNISILQRVKQSPNNSRDDDALNDHCVKQDTHHSTEHDQNDIKQCIACPSTFTSNTGLNQHLTLHRDVIRYLCDYCDLAFQRLLDLVKHMLQHPRMVVMTRMEEESMKMKDKIRKQRNRGTDIAAGDISSRSMSSCVNCPYCPTKSCTVEHVRRHIERHHLEKLQAKPTPEGKMKMKNMIANTETVVEHGEKTPQKCVACPMTFSFKSDLYLHLSTHKDVIYYPCVLCDISFKRLTDLVKHMLIHYETDTVVDDNVSGLRLNSEQEASVCESGDYNAEHTYEVKGGVHVMKETLEFQLRSDQEETGKGDNTTFEPESEIEADESDGNESTQKQQINVIKVIKPVRSSGSKIKKSKAFHRTVKTRSENKKKALKIVKEDAICDNREIIETNTDVLIKQSKVPNHSLTGAQVTSENKVAKDNNTPKLADEMKAHAHAGNKTTEKQQINVNKVVKTASYSGFKSKKRMVSDRTINANNEKKKRKTEQVQKASVDNSREVTVTKSATCINDHLPPKQIKDPVEVSSVNKCPHCGFTCKRESAMKFHINMSHPGLPTSVQDITNVRQGTAMEVTSSRMKKNAVRQFTCDTCNQTFQNSSTFKSHLRRCFRSVGEVDDSEHTDEEISDTQTGPNALSMQSGMEIQATADTQSSTGWPEAAVQADKCKEHDSSLPDSHGNLSESASQPTMRERSPSVTKKIKVNNDSSSTQSSYHCDQCGKIYSSWTALRYHIRKLHSGRQRSHRCEVCDKSYWLACELRDHRMAVHSTETPYICDTCGKGYPTLKGLQRHQSRHRDQDNDEAGIVRPSVTCDICGLAISSRDGRQLLYTHIQRSHPETVYCNCEICSSIYKENNDELVVKVKAVCEECNQCFCQKRYLTSHMNTVHNQTGNHECKFCTARFGTSRMLSNHVNIDHKPDKETFQKSLPVDESARIYVSSVEIALTVNVEHDADSFIRLIKSSKNDLPQYLPKLSDRGLSKVMKELRVPNNDGTTSSKLPFKCLLCQRCFAKGTYVNEHIRRSHIKNDHQPFRCKVCGSGFKSIVDFKKHSRTHSNIRPYKCRYCEKAFKQQANLNEHEAIHSYGQNEKCQLCKKTFKLRGTLLSHVLNHCKLHPFKCPFCDKAYPDRGQLSRHMKQYLSMKEKGTHMCHICSETFTHYPLLMTHLTTHNPAKPFKCEVCGEDFRSYVQLYFHKAKKDHFTVDDYEGIQQFEDDNSLEVVVTSNNLKYTPDNGNDELHSSHADKLVEIENQSEAIDESSTPTFVLDQSELSILNSNSEIVIETVGYGPEGTVYSVPDGHTSDEILSIAQQLTELSGHTMLLDKDPTEPPKKDEEQIHLENKEQEIVLEMLDVDSDKLEKLTQTIGGREHVTETEYPTSASLTQSVDYDEGTMVETNETIEINDNEVEENQNEMAVAETTNLYTDANYLNTVGLDYYRTAEGIHINIADTQGSIAVDESNHIQILIADDQAIGQQITIDNQEVALDTETIAEEAAIETGLVPTEENNVYHMQVVSLGDVQIDNISSLAKNLMDITNEQQSFTETAIPMDQHILGDIEVVSEVNTINLNVKDIQPIDGRFPCPICPARTKSRKYLREHLQRHQDDSQKMFACEHPGCSKKFFQGSDLRRHMLIHNDIRPHRCNICGKQFRQSGNLQSHMRIHTGERPFVCPDPDCSLSFITSTLLKTHYIRSHVDKHHFNCTLCTKSFKDRHSFAIHIGSKHSGVFGSEKNNTNQPKCPRKGCTYMCDQCGIKMSSKANLEDHMNIHSDNKPFICHACGTAFRTIRVLNQHIASIHRSEVEPKPKKRGQKKVKTTCQSCHKVFQSRTGYAYHIGLSEKCRTQLVLPSVEVPDVRVQL